jgi:hypothetical protein
MSEPSPSLRTSRSALRAFWSPTAGIFIGLWLFLMVIGQSRLFQDPGTFWHTVVGERMVSSGHLIYTDPFTFTFNGKHWIGHQWLGECLMALIHRLDDRTSFDSLLLVTVTILAGLYAWLAHRFLRVGLHWSLAAVAAVLLLSASASHFHIRPHIGSIVFLAVTMGYLTDFENGRIGVGRLAMLIPIYLVWTNIHGGTLGGLATIGITLAGWCGWRIMGLDSPIRDWRRFFGVCALLAGCIATIVITPYGTLIVRTWLAIMESPTLREIIVEHRKLTLDRADGWAIVLLGAAYLAALISTLPRWPRVTWLLPLVWFYLATSRIRHGPLFAVTAGVALADMLPYTAFARWAVRTGSDLFILTDAAAPSGKPRDFRPALLPALLVLTAFGLQQSRIVVPIIGYGWARLDPSYWPVELLPELEEYQDTRPDGTRIFNDYYLGGFLIYFTPGYRVFVDDRCELFRSETDEYTDQWLDEFVHARQEETALAIRKWQKQHGSFDFALVQVPTDGSRSFDDYFRASPDWELVKRTRTAALYRRIVTAFASLPPKTQNSHSEREILP